jgi:ornithine cyclodeaminase/alanine dehydrogenase-like protein (mu-crystallin family)
MSIRFRLLTETDVKAVLTMDDLVETMSAALQSYSSGGVTQPVRTVIPMEGDHAFFGLMPAFVRASANARPGLGAKLVTVVGATPHGAAKPPRVDPPAGSGDGRVAALLDGRFITEARTAAVSAVSSRLLARKTSKSLAIIGSGVQARSHLEALSRVIHCGR